MKNINPQCLMYRGVSVMMFMAILMLSSCKNQDESSTSDQSQTVKTMRDYELSAQERYYSEPDTMTQFIVPQSRATEVEATQLGWMSNIPDVAFLTDITIPGTHNSGANCGNNWVKCQNLSIEAQLKIGIRAFDIRCRHIGDAFAIHHGAFFLNKWFGPDVRDVFVRFLKDHPSESIILLVQSEHTATGNTRDFEETMQGYMRGYEKYFYLTENNPRLKDIRGKIVLLRRFSSNISPFGNRIYVENNCTSESYTTIKARIQDAYKVPTVFDFGSKWSQALNLLTTASHFWNGDNYNWLYINFLSGSGSPAPWDVANGMLGKWGMNQCLDVFLKPGTRGRFGILFMDYAGSSYGHGVVGKLIDTNNRLLERGQMRTDNYASSEEAVGEGPNNGRAIHAFDNNPNTFWHSQWKGYETKFPHSVTMSLGKEQMVKGMRFVHRKNTLIGRPRTYYVEYSPDGGLWHRIPVPTWSPEYRAAIASKGVRTIDLQGNEQLQYSFGSPVKAKFVRVTFLTSEGNTQHTFMAEVKVF